jgi:large subunit ribosomal protein L18
MDKKINEKYIARKKRHIRVRTKIIGTSARPRLNVYRGLKNMYAQIIDDYKKKTLISCATFTKDFKKKLVYGGNVKAAALLGEIVAEKAKNAGITKVVFDRGGFLYHGRIKAFADAARKAGLIF